jgi:hypothetical protein
LDTVQEKEPISPSKHSKLAKKSHKHRIDDDEDEAEGNKEETGE